MPFSPFKQFKAIDWFDFFTLALMLTGMLLFHTFCSVGLICLLFRVLFLGEIGVKWQKIKTNGVVLAVLLSLFLLYALGLLWSSNLQAGRTDLYHKITFLIVPIGVCIISPLKKSILQGLFGVYVAAIFVGTIIGINRYLIEDFPDIRTLIPHAANIRFAANSCFAIAIMVIIIYRKSQLKITLLWLPVIVWFVVYLVITQSITGICILCLLAGIALLYLCLKKRNKISLILSAILLFFLTAFLFWTGREAIHYFTCSSNNQSSITHTIHGNPYTFRYDNFIENGHYVNQYVCMEEVESAWKQRTGLSIDDLSQGKEGKFAYRDLLVRYLNSKGLKKDSAAIMALSAQDIKNLKAGFANVEYAKKFSLKPRLYKTFFEFERYLHEGYVKDGSLVKRIELCKNAAMVIKDYPIAGVGTGDVNYVLNDYLNKKSNRDQFNTHDPHNYFFFIGAEFGLLGIVVLLFVLIYPPIRQKAWSNPIFVVFFIINLCAMLIESSFNLFSGMVFFCLPGCLLLFNHVERLKFKIFNF